MRIRMNGLTVKGCVTGGVISSPQFQILQRNPFNLPQNEVVLQPQCHVHRVDRLSEFRIPVGQQNLKIFPNMLPRETIYHDTAEGLRINRMNECSNERF